MQKKTIVNITSSLYFVIVGAYIVFENITIYAKHLPASILTITYLQAILLISTGIFRRNWLRILLISWSTVCLVISIIAWVFGAKSFIREILYYTVPLLMLFIPKVREQFK